MKPYVSIINTVIICVTIFVCFDGFLRNITIATNTQRNTMERLIDQIDKSFSEYLRQQIIVVNSEVMKSKRIIRQYDHKVYEFVHDPSDDGRISLQQAYQ